MFLKMFTREKNWHVQTSLVFYPAEDIFAGDKNCITYFVRLLADHLLYKQTRHIPVLLDIEKYPDARYDIGSTCFDGVQ